MKKNVFMAGAAGSGLALGLTLTSLLLPVEAQLLGLSRESLLGLVGIVSSILLALLLFTVYKRKGSSHAVGGFLEFLLAQTLTVLILWPLFYSLALRVLG